MVSLRRHEGDRRPLRATARSGLVPNIIYGLTAVAAAVVITAVYVVEDHAEWRPHDHKGQHAAPKEAPGDIAAEVTAHYTRVLAILTGVLACVGVLQFGAAAVQSYWLRRADDAAQDADELERQKLELDNRRFLLEEKHVDALEKANALAKEEFFTAYRPRLGIRHFYFVFKPEEGDEHVQFHIVNRGDSTATVTEIRVYTIIRTAVAVKNSESVVSPPPPYTIGPSYSVKIALKHDSVFDDIVVSGWPKHVLAPVEERPRVTITVAVYYTDEANRLRCAETERRFDYDDSHFARIDGSDYESDN